MLDSEILSLESVFLGYSITYVRKSLLPTNYGSWPP